MIRRGGHLEAVRGLLRRHRVVAVLGARQVGKTTLARQIAATVGRAIHLDLEDPRDDARLSAPMLALEPLRGLVVLDEVQRRPDLLGALRVLADRPRPGARYLLLGSASPELVSRTAETLAGRIAYHELPPLTLDEVGAGAASRLWLRGGFPRSFAAPSLRASMEWRRQFVRTFLERDIPQLGVGAATATVRRLWSMLAHAHGQTLNLSDLGRSLGLADTTVRRYLDVLLGTYVVWQLPPWFENVGKRLVKAPKVYLRDSGLLHALLDVTTELDLLGHPIAGASWEGFCIQQIIARLGARPEECHFYRTHAGAELDLLVVRGRRRLGFEIKRTDAPRVTPSMRIALADLGLSKITVVHAGRASFPLAGRIGALAIGDLDRIPELP